MPRGIFIKRQKPDAADEKKKKQHKTTQKEQTKKKKKKKKDGEGEAGSELSVKVLPTNHECQINDFTMFAGQGYPPTFWIVCRWNCLDCLTSFANAQTS